MSNTVLGFPSYADNSPDELYPYVIWLSVELNVVIVVSSIPFLRPLFQKSQKQANRQEKHRMVLRERRTRDNSPNFGSGFSNKLGRSTLSRVDSQENIIGSLPMETGIHVTHEVSITYESSNVPYVHAALVGLVQGEIGNPRLARR